MGIAIIVISALLVFVLHFHTKVQNGSIILDGLWTARKVKIDLSSIEKERQNIAVFSLTNPCIICIEKVQSFFTRGTECVELVDKDGLVYLIGSQKADELTKVLENRNIEMKKLLSVWILLLVFFMCAQFYNPVSQEFSRKKLVVMS